MLCAHIGYNKVLFVKNNTKNELSAFLVVLEAHPEKIIVHQPQPLDSFQIALSEFLIPVL